jgi:hypothetical protein
MVQVIQRRNEIGDAIAQATQGFIQGRQLRQQGEDRSIANAYRNAQIKELERKTQALNEPAPAGYFRDPYSGKLMEDMNYVPSFNAPGAPQGEPTIGEAATGQTEAPILKEYKIGHRTFVNPAYEDYKLKQKEKENSAKPLSSEASAKLSAADQALGNIQTVREMATPEDFENLKSGFSKIRTANRLGLTNPDSLRGSLIRSIPFVNSLASMGTRTSDTQKKFENNLSTLIESQLRARTGAAAPQQEVDREVSRILASDDSLNSFLEKLSNSEKFALGIAEGIRPGSTKKYSSLPKKKSQSTVDLSSMSEEELKRLAGG